MNVVVAEPNEREKIIKLLLELDADPNAENKLGLTPSVTWCF